MAILKGGLSRLRANVHFYPILCCDPFLFVTTTLFRTEAPRKLEIITLIFFVVRPTGFMSTRNYHFSPAVFSTHGVNLCIYFLSQTEMVLQLKKNQSSLEIHN